MTSENTPTSTSQPVAGRWVGGRWVTLVPNDAASVEQFETRHEPGRLAPTEDAPSKPGLTIPFRIEWSIYAGLVLIALAMRIYDLGGRAVHHDESLHGYFAFQLFSGNGYDHNPLMHGMFLFHSIATSFFLFGDSDFSMRLPMALFGTGLVLVPLILKPRIGQVGALVAAGMLAFSPSILYYSRFARNDIFMAVFTLALVGVMWRYLDERKNRWLYIAAALMALGFTTKETQYIVVAILGFYLVTQCWRELRDWLYARRSLDEFGPYASLVVLMGVLVLPLLAAAASIVQGPLGMTLAAEDGLPGVPTGSPNGSGWYVAVGISAVLLATSLVIGWYWKRKVFLGVWAVFAFVFVMMFTNFGSNPGGIGSGAWQSLGYWLAQQDVSRGNQPWYYYFTIGAIYEFFPFAVATIATIYYSLKSGIRPWILLAVIVAAMTILANATLSFERGLVQGVEKDVLSYTGQLALLAVLGAAITFPFVLKTSRINKFLIFWTIATFVAYTEAGEKMPWLLVNVSLPAIVLAAKILNDVIMSIDWRNAIRSQIAYTLIGVPLFFLLLWKLAFHDLGPSGSQFISTWAILATLGVLLLGLQVLASRMGRSQALGAVGLVTAILLFGLTFRAGWVASYENGDIPREMLVYTQTAPDIHDLAAEIEQTANLTGDRSEIRLAIDTRDAYSWPWQWYLRRYSQVAISDHTLDSEEVADDRLIAVINENNNASSVTRVPEGFSEGRRLVHRWWFPEEYRGVTPGKFFETLIDRTKWKGSVDYFLYRKLSNPLGTIDSYVYFSDQVPLVPAK